MVLFRCSRSKRLISILAAVTLIFSLFLTSFAYAKPITTNTPPVITLGDTYNMSVDENSSVAVNLTAKDKDSMTWSNSLPVNGGTISISNPTLGRGTSTVSVSYTPKPGYLTDNFIVIVTDSKGLSDSISISVTINPNQVSNISYVALGDSIATGTIYPGKVITSYVTYFYNYLKTKYPQVTVTNLAHDGDRTNELYSKLVGDSTVISAVKSADIITISIGGNNLMQAAKDSSALGGYNFNKIDTAVANQGLLDFQNQWNLIINQIKVLNADVKIIVNSTYNPYNESDTALHNTVDSYLFRTDGQGLNDIILSNTGLGYSAANVYKYYDDNYKNNMGAITYFYPTDFWGTLTRNPHPNATGQGFITELCKAASGI